jgi:hypothetical protein
VRTQLTPSSEVWSACWISGSAGATSDWRSEYETPPSASTANVMPGCCRFGSWSTPNYYLFGSNSVH